MSNKGKNHVKLGIPISYINLWFQNELHKDGHLQNKMRVFKEKLIGFKVNHK